MKTFRQFMEGTVLTRQQKLQIASGLAMSTTPSLTKQWSRAGIFTPEEIAAFQDFAQQIEPLYPIPRDGHIPKKVIRLVNSA